MATEAQVVANRANAQKSTGPRTPEGREKASQNALRHGLFAREGVIRGEDEDEFEVHREMLLEQLNPVGPLEEILAARIVDLAWRLKRAVQDQNDAFVALYDRQTAGAEEPQEPAERAATLGISGTPYLSRSRIEYGVAEYCCHAIGEKREMPGSGAEPRKRSFVPDGTRLVPAFVPQG